MKETTVRIVRSASVTWTGGMKDGVGAVSTDSGALDGYPYGFGSRFEGVQGTNPEELIAAAHASCFTMALAMMLAKANHTVVKLETEARVSLESAGDGFAITSSRLKLKGQVTGLDIDGLTAIAHEAKAGCPVSKVLNTDVVLEVTAA
nr:OsmC family protein [Sinorhizobium sp. 7-81]